MKHLIVSAVDALREYYRKENQNNIHRALSTFCISEKRARLRGGLIWKFLKFYFELLASGERTNDTENGITFKSIWFKADMEGQLLQVLLEIKPHRVMMSRVQNDVCSLHQLPLFMAPFKQNSIAINSIIYRSAPLRRKELINLHVSVWYTKQEYKFVLKSFNLLLNFFYYFCCKF